MRLVRGPGLDRNANSRAFMRDTGRETPTQQSGKEDADVNVIMKRFGVTGMIPQVTKPPMQGDFTGCGNFHEAMNLVVAAKNSFMQLDAATRKFFDNDAAQYVAFCSDAKNLDKMREMGIAVPKAVDPGPAPPVEVKIVGGEDGEASERGRSRNARGHSRDRD